MSEKHDKGQRSNKGQERWQHRHMTTADGRIRIQIQRLAIFVSAVSSQGLVES
jgi:hypothetical protein